MEINKNSQYTDYFNYYNQKDLETPQLIESKLQTFNHASDLITKWYRKPRDGRNSNTPEQGREEKMLHCYENKGNVKKLIGKGLELGFGLGTSTHWLLEKNNNIVLDGIDFQTNLQKIIPFLKELYGEKIGDYSIGDMQQINKPDSYYDFINSSSIWEHLTDEVYWNTLKECYRVLKPQGKIYVYVDQSAPNIGEHIRVVGPEVTRREMESIGFKGLTNYVYRK